MLKPEAFYCFSGSATTDLFNTPDACKNFLGLLNEKLNPFSTILGFCLLPNAFSLLIKIQDEVACESYLKQSGLMAKNFQTFDEASGMLLMGTLLKNQISKSVSAYEGIEKQQIEEVDSSMVGSMLSEIHLCPIKKGLCEKPSEWMFSSYNAFVSDKPTKIPREEVYQLIGGKEIFSQLHS